MSWRWLLMSILDSVSNLAGSVANGVTTVATGAADFAADKIGRAEEIAINTGNAAKGMALSVGGAIGREAKSDAGAIISGAGAVADNARKFAQGIGNKVQQTLGAGFKLAEDVMDDPGKVIDAVLTDAKSRVMGPYEAAKQIIHGVEEAAESEIREVGQGISSFGGVIIQSTSLYLAAQAELELGQLYSRVQGGLSTARGLVASANQLTGSARQVALAVATLELNKARTLALAEVQIVSARMMQKVVGISSTMLVKANLLALRINTKVLDIATKVLQRTGAAVGAVDAAIDLASSLVHKALSVAGALLPSGFLAKANEAVKSMDAYSKEVKSLADSINSKVRGFAVQVTSVVQTVTASVLSLFTGIDLLATGMILNEIGSMKDLAEDKVNLLFAKITFEAQTRINAFLDRIVQKLAMANAGLGALSLAIGYPAAQIVLNVGRVIRQAGAAGAEVFEGIVTALTDGAARKVGPATTPYPTTGPMQRSVSAAEGGAAAGGGGGPADWIHTTPPRALRQAGRSIAQTVEHGVEQGIGVGVGILASIGEALGHPVDRALGVVQQIGHAANRAVDVGIDVAQGIGRGIAGVVHRAQTIVQPVVDRGIGLARQGVTAVGAFASGVARRAMGIADNATTFMTGTQPNDGDLTGVFLPGTPLPTSGSVAKLHHASSPGARESAIASGAAIFVNGINTQLSEHYAAAQRLANEINAPVVGVFNASASMVQDLVQCVGDKFFDRTRNAAVSTMARLIRSYGNAHEHNGGLRIFAHSQGSLIVSEAIRQAQQSGADIRHDDITTFGNAAFTFPAGATYHHYVHDDDPVSGLTGTGSVVSYLMNQTAPGRFLTGAAMGQTDDAQSRTVTLHHGGSFIDPHAINAPGGHDYLGDLKRFQAAERAGQTGTSSMHNTGALLFAQARGVGSMGSEAVSAHYAALDGGARSAATGSPIADGLRNLADHGFRTVGGAVESSGQNWAADRDRFAPGAAGSAAPSHRQAMARTVPFGGLGSPLGVPATPRTPFVGPPAVHAGALLDEASAFPTPAGMSAAPRPFAPWMPPSMIAPPHARSSRVDTTSSREPGALRAGLLQSEGSGVPLPMGPMHQLAGHLPGDASGARIHSGPKAAAAARNLGARAFTIGDDVFFGAGQYDPHSQAGLSLLGHELTHVVQQTGAGARTDFHTRQGGDEAEAEAQQVERQVLMGLVSGETLRVESFACTYEARSLKLSEQQRLDDLGVQALKQAQKRVRKLKLGRRLLLSLDIDIQIELELADGEIVDAWAEAIIDGLLDVSGPARAQLALQRSPIVLPLYAYKVATDFERDHPATDEADLDDWEYPDPSPGLSDEETEAFRRVNLLTPDIQSLLTLNKNRVELTSDLEGAYHGGKEEELLATYGMKLDEFTGFQKIVGDTFAAQARKVAGAMLDESARVTRIERDRYFNVEPGSELDDLIAAAEALAPQQEALQKALHEAWAEQLSGVYGGQSTGGPGKDPAQDPIEKAEDLAATPQYQNDSRVATEFELYRQMKRAAAAEYPWLGTDNLDYGEVADEEPMWLSLRIEDESKKILGKIDKTRAGLTEERVWSLPPVVQATREFLSIDTGSAVDVLLGRYEKERASESFWRSMAIAVIMIGLTIFTIATAGAASPLLVAAGTAAGLAATGMGIKMTYDQFKDYQFQKAAVGTAYSRAAAIADEDPSLFWLALSIAFTVIDLGGAVKAFNILGKLVKAEIDLVRLEQAAKEAYQVAKATGKVAKTEEEFVQDIMGAVERMRQTSGAVKSAPRIKVLREVVGGTSERIARIVDLGDEAAMKALLMEHGNWRDLMAAIEGTGLQHHPEIMKVAQKLSAFREKVVAGLGPGMERLGSASTNLVSDIDVQVKDLEGVGAGQRLLDAEARMAKEFGKGWSSALRLNFYTEASRLTQYQTIIKMLVKKGNIDALKGFQNAVTHQAERLNIAQMLHLAGDNPDALQRVLRVAEKTGVSLDDPLVKEALEMLKDPAKYRAQLLTEIDELSAKFATAKRADKLGLARDITKKQMMANLVSEEAYIAPGALRSAAGMKVAGPELYQTANSQLPAMEHVINQAGGNIATAARDYELFKYMKRFLASSRSQLGREGLERFGSRIQALEAYADSIYKGDRYANWAADVTDEALRSKWREFEKLRDDLLPEVQAESKATAGTYNLPDEQIGGRPPAPPDPAPPPPKPPADSVPKTTTGPTQVKNISPKLPPDSSRLHLSDPKELEAASKASLPESKIQDSLDVVFNEAEKTGAEIPKNARLRAQQLITRTNTDRLRAMEVVSNLEEDVYQGSASAKSVLRKARNSLTEHAKMDEMVATIRDRIGQKVVVGGKTFDHLGELTNARDSVKNLIADMRNWVERSYQTSIANVPRYESARQELERVTNSIDALLSYKM